MWNSLKRYSLEIVFILFFVTVLAANIANRITIKNRAPSYATPTYAMGHAGDYHQYIAFLKYGREGHMLYHNAWSEEDIPDLLLQPIYPIFGLITKPLGLSLFTTYFVFQMLSIGLLFGSVYTLIRSIFKKRAPAILAAVAFFFATGFWFLESLHPLTLSAIPIGADTFDPYLKYLTIPPHHHIAIALFVFAIVSITHNSKKTPIITAILVAAMGLIHPYIQLVALMVITGNTAITSIRERTWDHTSARTWLCTILFSLPGIIYYIYVYAVILTGFSVATEGIFSPVTSFYPIHLYFLSLGPLLLLSVGIFPIRRLWTSTYVVPLALWAYGPIVLFALAPLHLPINQWRLFQSFQQIPLALLAAISITEIVRTTKIYRQAIAITCILLAAYGSLAYLYQYQLQTTQSISRYINLFTPEHMLRMYEYLNANTPADSVVLAGEFTSNMIPEHTHNRVIIGHNGNNRNYNQKKQELYVFLSGNMPISEVPAFLDKYHVSYIVFGGDAPIYAQTPYTTLPYLHEVYTENGSISVVEVRLKK